MTNFHMLHNILIVCLGIAFGISFYFFILGFVLRQPPYTKLYLQWQMAVIFAILCDALSIYIV